MVKQNSAIGSPLCERDDQQKPNVRMSKAMPTKVSVKEFKGKTKTKLQQSPRDLTALCIRPSQWGRGQVTDLESARRTVSLSSRQNSSRGRDAPSIAMTNKRGKRRGPKIWKTEQAKENMHGQSNKANHTQKLEDRTTARVTSGGKTQTKTVPFFDDEAIQHLMFVLHKAGDPLIWRSDGPLVILQFVGQHNDSKVLNPVIQ